MTRAADLAKLIAGSSTLGGTGELVLKDVDTADGSSPKITFQTGDSDIAQDDVLGTIDFQAPDEGTGTDAILVSAGVEAKAEGDFSSSSNATSLTFKTGSSEAAAEKMRVDSSGNVLVGRTSTISGGSNSASGAQIGSNGLIQSAVSGDTAIALQRLSDNGDIIQFRKDTTQVGSIGTGSSRICIGNSDTFLTIAEDLDALYPASSSQTTPRDNAVDLGTSGTRFNNLYLSGGVFVGGTGPGNKLDDYEEGTWTPTFVNFDGTMTINTARYTKIGRLVTYELNVVVPSNSDGDAFQYTLPFTPSDNTHGAFVTFQEKGLEVHILGSNTGRHRLRDFSGNNRTFAQFSSSALYISGMFTT